jgi:hypothetical protein
MSRTEYDERFGGDTLDQAPDYPMQLMIGVFDFPAKGGEQAPSPGLIVSNGGADLSIDQRVLGHCATVVKTMIGGIPHRMDGSHAKEHRCRATSTWDQPIGSRFTSSR